jgi:hypothetical protein
MDFTKFPLEKLLFFVAGVIPGFVALLIFGLAHPAAFNWFFVLGFLGYKTKLCLILLVAFVVGNSLTTFLERFLAAIGGALGGAAASRTIPGVVLLQCRTLARPQLAGNSQEASRSRSSKDTNVMRDELYRMRCELVNLGPEADRPAALMALNIEKFNSEMDDDAWARWYDQYHWTILFPGKRDFVWHIANGLNFNLQTASLYILVSAVIVPAVRHWWSILPACVWVLLFVLESYMSIKNATDKWSTLSAQIRYLSEGYGGVGHSEGSS